MKKGPFAHLVATEPDSWEWQARMRLYLDTCCLNRPFDDRTQDRVRLEADAVLAILGHIASGRWLWVSSDVLDYELDQIADPDRRERIEEQTVLVTSYVGLGPTHVQRAEELEAMGFRPKDALHLACAESGRVNILLTTDDRFLQKASRQAHKLRVTVRNPLDWLREVSKP